ncbi:Regulator of sigma E protease [Alteripontixanthobacter maritimus]|uniref:Zinc metalloprotease n=1 Tax=Alteripontixanthobacter maritimus TaxID=2161824 RepID=A0A369QAT3_9SPHN|nr:RIP metalloprotease RseP [Alteripontixanthobacter maritimus]RDC60336.1 Regulator of sigma E protease [Alteripontixanthobacter maritimus]
MIESPPFWFYIAGFLLILGPLVTLHEFGHYLVGRMFGVGADAFSVGFGKELAGFTDKRGTRWKLSALPLGGYVQFRGDMNPASIPDAQAAAAMTEEDRQGAFQYAALWKRALIVFAGPATNLIITLAIFAGFALIYGKAVPTNLDEQTSVAAFAETSPAREAGMQIGDRIVAIDGEEVADFRDVVKRIVFYPNETIDITLDRDGRTFDLPVTIGATMEKDEFGNESKIGRIGVESAPIEAEMVPVGVGEAASIAYSQTVDMTVMMVTGIKQIVTGDRSVRELGGPLKIAKFSGEQLSRGTQAFVWFAALISLNLAFINLLPIPALDGGHLAFYAAEAIRRKPVGEKGMELAYRGGVVVVLTLMIFVTVNDIITIPWFGA